MRKEYDSLRNDLRRVLNRFRLLLLLSDLLKGFSFLFVFGSLFFLFSFVSGSFLLSIVFRKIVYYAFWSGGILLFFLFVFRPFLFYFSSLNLRNNVLRNRILKYLSLDRDVFISLCALGFNSGDISGDDQLKLAAFVQKYEYLKQGGVKIALPLKEPLKWLSAFLFMLVLFAVNMGWYNRVYADMADYEEVKHPQFNIDFQIQNESLNVEYGKSFRLALKVNSDFLAVENVFICFGGGEFLMEKKDSLFVYDFTVVNNNIRFNFKTEGVESKYFELNVLSVPGVVDFKVTYLPPPYTGLEPEVIRNVVDFNVLYGSVLNFEVGLNDTDSLFFKFGDEYVQIISELKPSVNFSRKITQSGEYELLGSNENFVRKVLMNFTIICVPDLYPGIQISELQDSLKNSLYYFYGVITDDYGFSDLRFSYSLNDRTNTVVPVRFVKNVNVQEFYFEFDFAEFAGMDKTKVNYFFEVFDNDIISGPKSTRSDLKNYLVPDLNTLFDYTQQVNEQVNSSLNEAEKLSKDIVSGVKELQKKLLDNSADNWEKQQLAKDIIEKKNKLDKLLDAVREENLKKSSLNESFTKQDSLLIDKQEKIQDLLNKIMDDDMKKLMEEFTKLSEEFSKDKFQEMDEKMKLSFDQMSEELDRNIELLKRYQVEEKHDFIRQQVDKLKEKQSDFERSEEDKSVQKDSLANKSGDLKNDLKDIKDNYNNLLKENERLDKPYDLKSMDQKFDELSQLLDKQDKNASEKKQDDQLSKEINRKEDELSKEIEQQQQQNFMQMSVPENDIELIIQNILLISLSEEELIKQFSGVPAQSPRYNELGRLQDLKKREYKIVKDSLSVLAKSNLMLASILSDKIYDIEIKFGLLPDLIQNNKSGELSKEQQFIVTYLNDLALSLSEALQKSKSGENGAGSPSNKKNGKEKKGSGNKKDSYGEMKNFQNGLKRQLEGLISQMKQGEKGKPLQQGISKMIRENELFKKSLNDFMSEASSLSNGERQLLNEINKLLEDNIQDMANYSISDNLMNRNNQIYNKLLLSEKASKEREEYEEKRRSVTANEEKFRRPEIYFNATKKSGLIKTDLHKSDVKLNLFFENMYNNYYIKLGNE